MPELLYALSATVASLAVGSLVVYGLIGLVDWLTGDGE
jgi:hypothetical protein